MKIRPARHDQIICLCNCAEYFLVVLTRSGIVHLNSIQAFFCKLRQKRIRIVYRRVRQYSYTSSVMNLRKHLKNIRIFYVGFCNSNLPIKKLIIQRAVHFVCIAGVHKRLHNMLLIDRRAALRPLCNHFRCNGIQAHNLLQCNADRFSSVRQNFPKQAFQARRMLAHVAKQMHQPFSLVIKCRYFSAVDHFNAMALPKNLCPCRARKGIVVCHRNG